LIGRCGELPQVVQNTLHANGTIAIAPEEPNVALAVSPNQRRRSGARQISGGGRSLDSVDTGLVQLIAAAHPGPFISSCCLRIGRKSEGKKRKRAHIHPPRQWMTSSHSHWSIPLVLICLK
jgi:hypothetical protein